ncbi:hypothetical protein D3C87_1701820 [compost metagenome]
MQAGQAHDQGGAHGHHGAGPHAQPGADAQVHEQPGRGIGAQAEVGGVAERELARDAAQYVPRQCQVGVQQRHGGDRQQVLVAAQQRQQRQRAQRGGAGHGSHFFLGHYSFSTPNSPLGRKYMVARNRRKISASA